MRIAPRVYESKLVVSCNSTKQLGKLLWNFFCFLASCDLTGCDLTGRVSTPSR